MFLPMTIVRKKLPDSYEGLLIPKVFPYGLDIPLDIPSDTCACDDDDDELK
jgi:hypothetical protein